MLLTYAIIFITAALIFYTLGVISEKIKGVLKPYHVVLFILGLICDTTGTSLMAKISKDPLAISLHSVTGFLAIVLMLIHTVWALYVLIKGNRHQKETFHKFSLFVWLLWLIPYFSGMIYAMIG